MSPSPDRNPLDHDCGTHKRRRTDRLERSSPQSTSTVGRLSLFHIPSLFSSLFLLFSLCPSLFLSLFRFGPSITVCGLARVTTDKRRSRRARRTAFDSSMEPATVVQLAVAFVAAVGAATATAAVPAPAFRYPDDDHVIITHYGPVRYKPVTAEQMNRPYGGGDDDDAGRMQLAGRGHYKAEVIPLDMKTWRPLSGPEGGVGGGDVMDVPMRVGYSVRPMPVRRRRNDYFVKVYPPSRARHRTFRPMSQGQPVRLSHGRRGLRTGSSYDR